MLNVSFGVILLTGCNILYVHTVHFVPRRPDIDWNHKMLLSGLEGGVMQKQEEADLLASFQRVNNAAEREFIITLVNRIAARQIVKKPTLTLVVSGNARVGDSSFRGRMRRV
jgi:hypothetical protein